MLASSLWYSSLAVRCASLIAAPMSSWIDWVGAGGMGSWGGGVDERFVGSGWVVSMSSSSPSLVLLSESDW